MLQELMFVEELHTSILKEDIDGGGFLMGYFILLPDHKDYMIYISGETNGK
jgi:hypothetical protein